MHVPPWSAVHEHAPRCAARRPASQPPYTLWTNTCTWGASRWFGIQLPVMMGVTFASVAPMISMAQSTGGTAGAGLIFGSVIGAGVISILIAPRLSCMLRFFLPVVIGINWIFGNPVGPTTPSVPNPEHFR